MSHLRQVFSGALVALISISIVLGGISIATLEGEFELAQVVPSAPPQPSSTPDNLPAAQIPTLQSAFSSTGTLTATPTLGVVDGCPPPTGWVTILVKRGDTLEALASAYKSDPTTLKQKNCLEIDELPPGSLLFVPKVVATPLPTATELSMQAVCGPPPGWVLYTVKPNDNLYRLGLEFDVTFEELQWANCLGNSRLIVSGRQIYVPPGPALPTGITPVLTQTQTRTPTPSPSQPSTATEVPATFTPTDPPTTQPTATPTPTGTSTSSPTPSATATATSTTEPTNTPTLTATPTSTATLPAIPPSVTLEITYQIPE